MATRLGGSIYAGYGSRRHQSSGRPVASSIYAAPAAFTPASIAGCRLWLDAAKGIVKTGSNINSWADQSGSANHTTALAGKEPVFVSSNASFNSKPTVSFPTFAARLDNTTTNPLTAGSPRTIFIVGRVNANADYNNCLSIRRGGNNTMYALGPNYSCTDGVSFSALYVPPATYANTYIYEFSSVSTGASGGNQCRLNGTGRSMDGEYVGSEVASAGFAIGDRVDAGAGQPNNYDLAEILIYDTVLSPANAYAVRSYLATKYALTIPVSDAAPSLVAGLKLHLRGDLGVVTSGTTVSRWLDQSAFSNRFVQVTGANQPTFVASAINTKPGLQGTSTAQMTGSDPVAQNAPRTHFLVILPTTIANGTIWAPRGGAGFCLKVGTLSNEVETNATSATANFPSGGFPAGAAVVQYTFDGVSSNLCTLVIGATSQSLVNGFGGPGVLLESATAGATLFNGGLSNGSILAEFLTYDTALSAPNALAVRNYLKAKYGL